MLGPVVLVAPIASAYAAGPAILAVVLLGERLSIAGAVGAVAAIAGTVVVSAGRRGAAGSPGARRASGVPFGLVAMGGFAISAFMIAAFAQQVGCSRSSQCWRSRSCTR